MENSYLLGEVMGHPGLVLLLVMGGSLITPALYNSLLSIRELLFSRRCFRKQLEKRIRHSQLGKMLTRRDIDLQYYLFSQPPCAIEKHIRNCNRCDSLDQCNCFLENKRMNNNVDLPFCRNNDAILKTRNQQEKLYLLRNTNF